MKLTGSHSVRSWRRCRFLSSRVCDGVLCRYSTSSSTSSPSTSSSENNRVSSLYKRISIAGDPRVSMAPILDEWIQEGHEIDRKDLYFLVNRLRNFRRFTHALQVLLHSIMSVVFALRLWLCLGKMLRMCHFMGNLIHSPMHLAGSVAIWVL